MNPYMICWGKQQGLCLGASLLLYSKGKACRLLPR